MSSKQPEQCWHISTSQSQTGERWASLSTFVTSDVLMRPEGYLNLCWPADRDRYRTVMEYRLNAVRYEYFCSTSGVAS